MIRAIIFDCFGVIRHDNIRPAYRKLGGDVAKDDRFIADTTAAANNGFIPSPGAVFAERLGVSEAAWEQACHDIGTFDQELLTYIVELRKTHKIGLLTNLPKNGLAGWFTSDELDRYFDQAIASGDVGYAKPQPEIYQLMAEGLGVTPAECVMVDDRQDFCDGAAAAGMAAVRYIDLPQLRAELTSLLLA